MKPLVLELNLDTIVAFLNLKIASRSLGKSSFKKPFSKISRKYLSFTVRSPFPSLLRIYHVKISLVPLFFKLNGNLNKKLISVMTSKYKYCEL